MDSQPRLPVVVLVLVAVVAGPVVPVAAQLSPDHDTSTDDTTVVSTETVTVTESDPSSIDTPTPVSLASTPTDTDLVADASTVDSTVATPTETAVSVSGTTETVDDTTDETVSTVEDTSSTVDDTTDSVDGTVDDTTNSVDETVGDTSTTDPVGETTDSVDDTTDSVDGTVDDTTNSVDEAVDGTTDETVSTVDGTRTTVDDTTDAVDDTTDGGDETVDDTSTTVEGTIDPVGESIDGGADPLRDTTGGAGDASTGVSGSPVEDETATTAGGFETGDTAGGAGDPASPAESESPGAKSVRGSTDHAERAGDVSDERNEVADEATIGPNETAATAWIPPTVATVVDRASAPLRGGGFDDVSTRDAAVGGTAALAAIGVLGGLAAKSGAVGFTPGSIGGVGTTARGVAHTGIARVRRFVPIPGYSRHDDSDPLENANRLAIYEAIGDSPGVHPSKLVETTECSMRTVRYHCRILEEEQLVSTEMLNGKKRLYPIGSDARELLAAMLDEPRAAVLLEVADEEPVSVTTLADALDRAPSTVSHHLESLESDGLVERVRAGKSVETRLASDVRGQLEGSRLPSREALEGETERVATVGEADD